MICEICGTEYDREDAEYMFEDYFNFDLSYYMEIDGHLCGDCAINYVENKIKSQDDYRENCAADDGMPEGCAACGGDYPNCTTSCPLYDI